jgi:phage terminase large subunit-like protein
VFVFGVLTHAAQPLMSWCISNAKVEQKANGVMITKAASGTAKIDPVMAILMRLR